MDINKRYKDNLKKFVLAQPDIKNRANIDEKRNKEEFKKLGSNLEGIVSLMRSGNVGNNEEAHIEIEKILNDVNSFFRYVMAEQVRFNQKDKEEIRDEISRMRESLNILRTISPAYGKRINSHLKNLDEIKSMTGGIRMGKTEEGEYKEAESVNDDGRSIHSDDYQPSIAYRINHQMTIKRNNNYLPSKLGFNEPESM